MTVAHPAKFADAILKRISEMIPREPFRDYPTVLDPFAGTGEIHRIKTIRSFGIEIEHEWAQMHDFNIIGNTLALPFRDATFDGIITSPCYGNRMADHHNARDGSRRHTYTHVLGRKLHTDNSGTLQWGDDYKSFHDRAWTECLRTLKPGGFVIINVSNHIRRKKEQPVVEWHLSWFLTHRCVFVELDHIKTKRMREGANYLARVPHEFVLHLRYQPPEAAPCPPEQSGDPSAHTAPAEPG
jgi:SAM-dependent methyltransferase